MPSFKDRLNELLIKNKLISQPDLDKAISIQKEKGGRLSDILVNNGFVTQKNLALVLSQQLKFPIINLSRYKMDENVVKLVPFNAANHYQIIPISLVEKTLTLAMADPLNIFAIDHISSLTGYEINPVIATPNDISEAITQNYGGFATSEVDGILKNIDTAMSVELIKVEKEEPIKDEKTVIRLTQEAPVIKITNFIISQAVKLMASDILIEPLENKARVRYRVDGVLQEAETPPKTMLAAIISRIKVISELNVAEHRLPQDGSFKMKLQNKEVDFRVSVLPSSFGEKIALRILDKSTAMLDVEKLGFSTPALNNLKKAVSYPHGMVLVCGPTGSGKTTTLYSLIKLINLPTRNIITVEDPIEYQLEGVNQINARPDIGLTFARSLRSILRQDPDIIMIGEIRDFETADISIKAALTGHLVLSTLHTTTAPGSITRLINMGIEPFLISSSVICVLSQRLIRKICDNCKEPYKPPEALLDTLGLRRKSEKRDIKFYKGKGCNSCLNTGYRGRIGLSEVLMLTPAIKDLILLKAEEYKIKKVAMSEKMQTLREDGLEKVLAGITTIEEVLRVTAPDEEETPD